MENSVKNQQLVKIRTEAKPGATNINRMAYVDMVKFVLTILVIMVHAAVTYGGAGDWTYMDNGRSDMMTQALLSIFVIYSQSFFMSLFFFFAGYFTPASFERKGIAKFWKDRLVHLGIPMLLYTFVLSRIPNYLNAVDNYGVKASFWQYSLNTFIREADGGPTWFLFALLLFSLAYTLVMVIKSRLSTKSVVTQQLKKVPGTLALVITATGMGLAMFLVGQFMPIAQSVAALGTFNLIIGFFPFYIVFYVAGILAYRNNWMAIFSSENLKVWKWVSIFLVVFMPMFIISTGALETGLDPYTAGFSWKSGVMCLWLAFSCVSFSLTLTAWMHKKIQENSRLTDFISTNTYAVYIIHPVILVAITALIRGFAIHPLGKFLLASAVSTLVCYLAANLLRKIKVLRIIL